MSFLRSLAQSITRRPKQDEAVLISDERLDALVDEAKREGRVGNAQKPIFDFGPGSAERDPAYRVVEPPQQTWVNPAYDRGIAPSRPFGRRS